MAWTTKSMLSHFCWSAAKAEIDRALLGDVAIDQRSRIERLDEGRHALLEALTLIGESELRTGFMERAGDAPGDGAIVGHAHDEAALALHEAAFRHGMLPRHNLKCPLRLRRFVKEIKDSDRGREFVRRSP